MHAPLVGPITYLQLKVRERPLEYRWQEVSLVWAGDAAVYRAVSNQATVIDEVIPRAW